MNEEELKEEEMWTCPICKEENFFDYPCKNGCEKKINKKKLEEQRDDLISYTLGYQEGFQKGKLEQKKEDFDYLFENWDGYDKTANMIINDFKRQLQKEIGGGVSKE